MKTCKTCKIEKTLDNYYMTGKYVQSYCKPCQNKLRNKYYKKREKKGFTTKDLLLMSKDLRAGLNFREIGEKYKVKSLNVGNYARRGRLNFDGFEYRKQTYKPRTRN